MSFSSRLADICREEYARWDNGAGRENQGRDQAGIQKDFYLFVKEYWVSIGNNNLTGRTIVNGKRPAWSSAFVSHCVKKAQAGSRFLYTQAHCHYINSAMIAADNPTSNFGYVARLTTEHKPQVGDILCGGREYAKRYDYDQAKLIYEADTFYPSHGDIVVEVTPSSIKTIGGNIVNNVDRKSFPLTSRGFVRDRIVNGEAIPWIAILSCRL